jgi:hypothetical protein
MPEVMSPFLTDKNKHLHIELGSLPEEDEDKYRHKGDKTLADGAALHIQVNLADHVGVDDREENPVGVFAYLDDLEGLFCGSRVYQDEN